MPPLIAIEDPDDPRIAAYRQVRERDLVGRQGLFVAEGEVVLRMLAASPRYSTRSVLIAQRRAARLAPILSVLPAETPVFVADQAVLDSIAGFHLHRGILAMGERGAETGGADLLEGLPSRALVLALCGIANHDNMGGLFRNAAAFGADAVLLDSDCCDPFYRKAIRVSVGGVLTVPHARLAPGVDMVDFLAGAGFKTLALSPHGASALAATPRYPRMAVVLGAEGPGLPEAVMARVATARIPMAQGFDSLNVATTAGIVLHHLAFVARADEPGSR